LCALRTDASRRDRGPRPVSSAADAPGRSSIWIIVVAALAGGFVLSRTKFGRWLYAVGGNREAARLSGIDMKVAAFAFSGLAAGIGGAIVVSRTATGQAGAIILTAVAIDSLSRRAT
jgi:ribose/xylose/arabinose/galactoside ABC-type transport system permease subunit